MTISRGGRPAGGVCLLRLAALVIAAACAAALARGQQVNEFPIGSTGLALEIALGSDGNLWFTEMVGKIGRITPAGVITEFPIPTAGSFPQSIAGGPDGALWFTENGKNKIGRVTTDGDFTEFPIPTANSGPFGIAAGPDGNLWFTEDQGNQLGRITTAGVITEFPIATAGAVPHGIAAGPDGNLWFTERGKNKVGRMSTSGVFDDFPIPTSDTFPEGITAGPDGNLWFTENAGHKIGRVTPAGVVTEFPLSDVTRVFQIAAGSDGNLWFTEFDGNKIGRITTGGTITEFLIPTSGCQPYGITTGPDDNPWFIEFGAAQVAQFVIGGPAPPQIDEEYPIPAALPEDVAWGSDGNVWYADLTGKIGRMTPAGVTTEFTIPTTGSDPEGMTLGLDGAIWFTEKGKNQIGRITTSGGFTEYPLPTPVCGPNGIAVGPDGAIWFTEFNGDKIGRFGGAGNIAEHPIPAASTALAIASGSDGNLWFTEYGKNKIGRISPSGDYDDFTVPTATAYPEGIAPGADGNLWFVENNGHKVGRITPTGTITEFPLPVATRSFRIAAGPDGNLWFTEFDNNKIGRITTAGLLKEYLIPTGDSRPYGIAAGTDRNLWFSEFNAQKIGRVGVGDPTLVLSGLAPTSGPAGGGTPAQATSAGIPSDATLIVGGVAAGAVSVAGADVSFTTPALPPGTLDDVVVTDPATGSFGRIDRGWLADFTDVPQAHTFHAYVEKLVRDSVTAGCGSGNYCPAASVTRAQMAVFLLKAEHGAGWTPPPATGGVFGDVPAGSLAAAWIEALAAEGITGGCGGGDYCPSSPVLRQQMAVFLLKAEHGASYVPPSCAGTFDDVSCPSPFADWIERLASEQITGGCGGGDYCPIASVTRGQMAAFLVKTFDLP